MKRIVSTLITVFVVGWAFLAEAHDVEVVLYPTIGPVSIPSYGILSPSFAGFAANVLNGLQSGRRDYGGSILVTPTAFNTIGFPISNKSGKVTVGMYDTWATKGTSWRGFTFSHGPFANEHGTHFRAAVAITSRSPFTLNDVNLSFTYIDDPGPYTAALGDIYTSFNSVRLLGISWGPDGSPGGGDDIVYDSKNPGSNATPINQLFFVGQGQLNFADAGDPRSDAQQFAEDYLPSYEAYNPYTFTNTYSLRGVSSTVTVAAKVTNKPGSNPHPGSHHHFRPFRLYPIR